MFCDRTGWLSLLNGACSVSEPVHESVELKVWTTHTAGGIEVTSRLKNDPV
jgi:hypothetical protein